jgi:EAL and modified HD-GYP domain-containing signal transduction protein
VVPAVVARQPILEADGTVHGYELLFRAHPGADFAQLDQGGDHATAQVLVTAVSEFGLDALVGRNRAFINVTRAFVLGELPIPVDPGRAVLEILEDVEPDETVVRAVRALVEAGHLLALDDALWTPAMEPLLELASYVKVDIAGRDWTDLAGEVARMRRPGLRIVAERVETADQLQACLANGFDLVQGYLFSRPMVQYKQSVGAHQVASLRLMTHLAGPEPTVAATESLVRADPGLANRVLRLANSTAAGQRRAIASIRDAVVLVGSRVLLQWALLFAVSDGVGRGHDLTEVLIGARMCELEAERLGGVRPDVAFVAGMLDRLAPMLVVSLPDLLEGLALDPELEGALLDRTGALGSVVAEVEAYLTDPQVRHPWHCGRSYVASLVWAQQTSEALLLRDQT